VGLSKCRRNTGAVKNIPSSQSQLFIAHMYEACSNETHLGIALGKVVEAT
jgi:hypothetical protein